MIVYYIRDYTMGLPDNFYKWRNNQLPKNWAISLKEGYNLFLFPYSFQ